LFRLILYLFQRLQWFLPAASKMRVIPKQKINWGKWQGRWRH